ncbi:MAG: putative motility protein [Spirochaetaceae bacterium]
MIESIAAAQTSMSQAQLQQQASTSVLKQAMDVQEAQGAAIAKLISSAGSTSQSQQLQDPGIGQNVNILV